MKSYLSAGSQQAYWRRLFSELQILLYHHPINQRRQMEHKPLINSLWFWGEGTLPAPPLTAATWSKVWTDSAFAKGLTCWNRLPLAPIPVNFSQCDWLSPAGQHLLIFPDLQDHLIEQWEQQWCQPLLNGLKAGSIAHVTIYSGQRRFSINRKLLGKWWRRPYK
jgi:hypothetical protein